MRRLLASAVLALTLTSPAMGQQSLIWPMPDQPGVVRDLTHTPALPFFPTDPTNLQSQEWAQPGSAFQYRPSMGWISPERPGDHQFNFRFTETNRANEKADRLLQSYERMK
jgi:hypothetical protein